MGYERIYEYGLPSAPTETDLKESNGWKKVVAEFHDNTALFDILGKEYIYPGDEDIVHKFNKRHNEKERFVLNTIPYPWLGNPLKAKIIILSQNPGWVENSCKVIPIMLQNIPQIAEELMEFFRHTYKFEYDSFMPEDRNNSLGLSARDAFNAMGDWYWKKRFHFLVDAGVKEDNIYNNIALIQYVPYSSVCFAPLPKNDILPSQKFTRRLIDYIGSNNENTVFIVPRAVNLWKEFLGNRWSDLEAQGRIIKHLENTYRAQYISPNCLGEDNFKKIINLLNE